MKKTYIVKGMHCSSCKKIIEMELSDQVNKLSIDVNSGKTEIDFNEDEISEKEIIDKITKLGYKVLR